MDAKPAAAEAAIPETAASETTVPEPAVPGASAPAAVLLVHEGEPSSVSAARRFAAERGLALHEIEVQALLREPAAAEGRAHWVLAVPDERLAALFELAVAQKASLGLLAAATSMLPRLFGLPKAPDAQLALAFDGDDVPVDLTRCNGEPVLSAVTIGDVPFLDNRGRVFVRAQPTLWARARAALGVYWKATQRLFAIRPTRVQLRIGDEDQPRRTAITGIVVFENDAERLSGQLAGDRLSARDGRLSALLLAPASVVAYLAALGRGMFGGDKLPRAFSFVKTRKLLVESEPALAYRVDGRRRSATQIRFEVEPAALAIKAGPAYAEANPACTDERDTLRLQTLPENEARLASISSRLPLFTHALEDDFKDLFRLLRDSARVTPDYLALMLAATLLAGFGLVLNSPAVIIGAMVLAPLMSPIISLAMGILRRDTRLLQASLRTIAIGVALAFGAAALLALLTPLRRVTPEIEARLHPTLLDLGVAVVSGWAAAYAYAREGVMKTLPGVAIAVALVPPLAVAGIGFGWGEARIVGGALLLFLTNLVGIASTAALTFLVLGYAPIQTAARGLRILAAALLAMALPLYVSFHRIVEVWQLERQLQSAALEVGSRQIALGEIQVSLDGERAIVRATASAPDMLSSAEIDALKAVLERRLGRPVQLELSLRVVR
ncbi:DUF389 domain-containing protein [Solimonas flava]|uniref:DUF389 domain-containing protein n=1 Tax=Solimonas flava TaxID=415849 RepID=UPI0004230214|nr:DUF389 domain-containing protein [Solimonas flava]